MYVYSRRRHRVGRKEAGNYSAINIDFLRSFAGFGAEVALVLATLVGSEATLTAVFASFSERMD
jgi:hypothetical protein